MSRYINPENPNLQKAETPNAHALRKLAKGVLNSHHEI